MPGVFPDYPAPVVRNADTERELVVMRWGMPPPLRAGRYPVTNIRNTSSPHWRRIVEAALGGFRNHVNFYAIGQNNLSMYALTCTTVSEE
jgi:hypothetical protein